MSFNSIANKLLFWFLVLSIIPIIVLSYLNYQAADQTVQEGIRDKLAAIADSRITAIQVITRNIQANIAVLAQSPLISMAIGDLQTQNARSERHTRFLRTIAENFNYTDIVITTADGKVLYSQQGLQQLRPSSELWRVFDRAVTFQEVSISSFEPQGDGFTAYVAVPVFDSQKRIMGTIIVGLSDRQLWEPMTNYTGLGLTGESLLVVPVQGKYTLINPTRHDRAPSTADLVGMRSVQLATTGTSGFGTEQDYRQKQVLAAWQYVPSLHGGLIVKIDQQEALQPLQEVANSAITIAVGGSLLVALVALVIARSISQPIIDLTAITKAVISGDFTWEAPIPSKDEIGELARSFNTMLERLQASFQELSEINQTLEQRVEERTKSLQWAYLEINLLNEKLQEENLRMSSELEITRRLQQLILPREEELSNIATLEIAGFMQPATEVGGDYYDVIKTGRGVHIAVGDITGHGLESGILMIMLQTAVRTIAHSNIRNPMKYINILNRVIYENIQRIQTNKSLTLLLLEYDEHSNLLRLTGQHEEAIIVRRDGTVQCIDTMDLGFPLGLEEDITNFIGQVTVQLDVGDVVVLYTDGITEAENPRREFYGQERLCEVARCNAHLSAQGLRAAIINDLNSFIGSCQILDDITLVTLKKVA